MKRSLEVIFIISKFPFKINYLLLWIIIYKFINNVINFLIIIRVFFFSEINNSQFRKVNLLKFKIKQTDTELQY